MSQSLNAIPSPKPLELNEIPSPKELDLNEIRIPSSSSSSSGAHPFRGENYEKLLIVLNSGQNHFI